MYLVTHKNTLVDSSSDPEPIGLYYSFSNACDFLRREVEERVAWLTENTTGLPEVDDDIDTTYPSVTITNPHYGIFSYYEINYVSISD